MSPLEIRIRISQVRGEESSCKERKKKSVFILFRMTTYKAVVALQAKDCFSPTAIISRSAADLH